MKRLYFILCAGVAALLLPACNGILSGIYEEPEITSDYGFMEVSTGSQPGIIYINATDYMRWTYINFAKSSIDTLSVDEVAPAEWDIAIHRYDAKTNGGKVAETEILDIESASVSGNTANLIFSEDEWTTSKIVTDMSHMMDGYLLYTESDYNRTLSGWLDVDTSTMPPVYTPSGKVYIVAMSDGRKAAVKLRNYMDTSGVKGYMTIQYIYPL